MSRRRLSPNHPPIQLVPGPFKGVKRPECGTEHTTPSSAEVKNLRSFPSSPPRAYMVCIETTLPFQPFIFILSLHTWFILQIFHPFFPTFLNSAPFLSYCCEIWERINYTSVVTTNSNLSLIRKIFNSSLKAMKIFKSGRGRYVKNRR